MKTERAITHLMNVMTIDYVFDSNMLERPNTHGQRKSVELVKQRQLFHIPCMKELQQLGSRWHEQNERRQSVLRAFSQSIKRGKEQEICITYESRFYRSNIRYTYKLSEC